MDKGRSGAAVGRGWARACEWLLPPMCALCGARGAQGMELCRPCRADLPRHLDACPRCGRAASGLCGGCVSAPPPWSAACIPWLYAAPLDRLIPQLKFGGALRLARLLGELLAEALTERLARGDMARPDCIVPVPLHPARLRERGFNQALELSRPAARRLGVPIDRAACRRVRATPAQSGLTLAQRRANPRGAFRVADAVAGRRVALLDDVVTTGATAEALSRALLRGGAAEVLLWSVAWTPPQS